MSFEILVLYCVLAYLSIFGELGEELICQVKQMVFSYPPVSKQRDLQSPWQVREMLGVKKLSLVTFSSKW